MSPPLILALALAAEPTGRAALEPAFKGTIVSTYPDGRKGRLMLDEGGTYAGIGRRGDKSSGTWSLNGERICLKQRKPVWTPFHYCTAVPSAKTWSAKAPTGEAIRVHLEAGR